MSEKPRLVFGILAVNSLVHLLLDAVEIKWSNGVHLFAPLNWQLLSFDLVWPDSVLVAVLSLLGLVIGLWVLAYPVWTPIHVRLYPNWRLIAVILLVSLYAFGPLAFLHGPYSTDANSIATLQEREHRVGKEIRMDREDYEQRADGDVAITFAGEPLRVVGDIRAEKSSQVSLIGEFVDVDAVRIHQLHEYHSPWRGLASYIGLGLLVLVWAVAFVRERRSREWKLASTLVEGEVDKIMILWIIIPRNGFAMEGTPRSFMWNRIVELEIVNEDRPKIAQGGREIANFFFFKAIAWVIVKILDDTEN